jgi:hypothetical protein
VETAAAEAGSAKPAVETTAMEASSTEPATRRSAGRHQPDRYHSGQCNQRISEHEILPWRQQMLL